MKIIDLLNKIANGEEVPKKIKYNDKIFIYDGFSYIYENKTFNEYNRLEEFISYSSDLNDEVEILEEKEICHKCNKYPAEYNQTYCEFCLGISKLEEEKKIPEKIQKDDFEGINEEEPKLWIAIRKINEIIDYLDYLKSKGDE